MTDQLRSDGMITSPVVERAFRTVPRHLFVPEDTPLGVAYHADDSVTIKMDQDGAIISSISAPFIQARMIEQIQAWDRRARSGPAPTFAYWPAGTDHPQINERTAVLDKTHGLVTISWPATSSASPQARTRHPTSER